MELCNFACCLPSNVVVDEHAPTDVEESMMLLPACNQPTSLVMAMSRCGQEPTSLVMAMSRCGREPTSLVMAMSRCGREPTSLVMAMSRCGQEPTSLVMAMSRCGQEPIQVVGRVVCVWHHTSFLTGTPAVELSAWQCQTTRCTC